MKFGDEPSKFHSLTVIGGAPTFPTHLPTNSSPTTHPFVVFVAEHLQVTHTFACVYVCVFVLMYVSQVLLLTYFTLSATLSTITKIKDKVTVVFTAYKIVAVGIAV